MPPLSPRTAASHAHTPAPTAGSDPARGHPLGTFPLIGRRAELTLLSQALHAAERGRAATIFLAGEGGIGKTRLAQALVDEATRRGVTVALGRAYPIESGVPYALFSDAFLPTLRSLDPASLAVLSRGGEAELAALFPALSLRDGSHAVARGDAAELKARLLWNFSQFLARFAGRRPLLVVLENLQWADASSLELLHFTARQLRDHRIVILCSYNEAERDANAALATAERSLLALGVARTVRLAPLARAESDELLGAVFDVDPSAIHDFAALLYERARGNPFFIEEMLKSLVDAGTLRRQDGRWVGWELTEFDLPRTIRDAVLARVGRLSPVARSIADLAAVLGARAPFDVLEAVSGLSGVELVAALDELRRARVLTDAPEVAGVCYDFTHPTLQATLYAELGRARARLLHGRVASVLEATYGAAAEAQAGELAFHFARADAREAGPKAVRYLAAAGRAALARYATREAASYLAAALDLIDRDAARTGHDAGHGHDVPAAAATALANGERVRLVEDLARAKQRSGEYDAARDLWRRALDSAAAEGDLGRTAHIERRLGLVSYWTGRHEEAFRHFTSALSAAERAGDERLAARLRIANGVALLELGRSADARRELEGALAAAERARDDGVIARGHRTLMQLNLWVGRADEARAHGERAIAHAMASHDRGVEWAAHWGIAVLAGLTGNAADLATHVREAERIADEIRSPVMSAWTNEVAIEYASGIGDWETGLALAERTIPIARAVGERMLLPRLLVWTGLMHLGRGELERAHAFFDESWSLSGAADAAQGVVDVHTAVPAHTGMAAYALATMDRRRAIELGEAGVALADRSGVVAWSIHRLIPIIIEAALWLQDFERAEHYGARLRRDSAQMGHRLGLAWATASDALVARLRDRDLARAAELLRSAADQLDAVPFVFDAARIRRNLAELLALGGDREAATHELRRAHDVFARLGAERELRATRDQLRDLGARPPARIVAEGTGALTGREREIARLVAERKSNKEIGTALGISARTVSTHLSNIFAKVGVASRGELTDWVRADERVAG